MHRLNKGNYVTQRGFTFIELIAVIVLIGLLSAVALPRFLEVADDAQISTLQGVSGGLATAIAMAHAQWKAEGNQAPAPTDANNKTQINMDGKIIYMNENGWPANASSALESGVNGTSDQECLEVWDNVLQSSPPATTVSSERPDNRYFASAEAVSGDIFCRYELIINQSENAVATHYIDYRLSNGDVISRYPNRN